MTTTETPPAVEPMVRAFDFRVDRAMTRAENDPRIPIAISSEYPVMRWDWERGERYREILDHSPGSVNMQRAARGLPFIGNHSTREFYGKVEDARVDPDRVFRGYVRLSRSQAAQDIGRDMEDDLRTEVSVGYDPGDDYTESRGADGVLERRYTNWTPLEVSTVPIPADPTVGKGRAHPAPAVSPQPASVARSDPMEPSQAPTAPAAPAATPAPVSVERAEQSSRESTLLMYGAAAGLSAEETRGFIASSRSVAEIGQELLARMQAKSEQSAAPKPAVELTEREQAQYSIVRALNSIISGKRSGFELEVSDQFAKATGRDYSNDNSLFLPLNIRTQLSVGAANKGAELRGTELRPELIELLRQRSMAIGTLGARFMPGLVGNVAFPRQTAGASAVWVAEAPGSDMALSSLSLDQVTLSPRTLQGSTTVSRQLLAQSTPAADEIIFDDLIAQHATAIDQAVFWGTGASNQPTGVGVAAGTNLIVMGTNGLAATLAKVLEMFREVEVDNGLTDNVAFVTTPQIKYSMAAIVRFASTDSRTLWDLDTSTVIGVPAYATNNVPSNLTKGTSVGVAHGAIYGDFSRVMVGEWGAGAELIVDPYTLARRNLIAITSIQFADVQVRIPSAFSVNRDLLV